MSFIAWITLALVVVSTPAADAAQLRTQLPGTGISIVAPEGFVRSSLGSGFNDTPRHSFIVFTAAEGTPGAPSFEDNYREMYPRPPERVEVDGASGELYQKVRRTEGGAWDGLTLVLRKKGHVIFASAQYFGEDPNEISKLRSSLLSIRWDGAPADAEAAFGVALHFDGLRLVPTTLGALIYTPSGLPASGAATATVTAMPIASELPGTFIDKCKAVLGPAFRGKPMEGVRISKVAGKDVCERWSAPEGQQLVYMGMVAMHPDAALVVSGWAVTSDLYSRGRALATLRSGIAGLGNPQRSNR